MLIPTAIHCCPGCNVEPVEAGTSEYCAACCARMAFAAALQEFARSRRANLIPTQTLPPLTLGQRLVGFLLCAAAASVWTLAILGAIHIFRH